MSDDIDTRVSLSLDPGTWMGIEGYGDDTAKFVGSVVNAINDAHHALGKLHTARQLWTSNPAVTSENAIIIVGREGDKHKQRVLRRLDLASQDLEANISHTTAQLMEPLTERAGMGSLNTETRAHVKSLGRGEREEFMQAALDSDDDATLTAILGGQHFLSGMSSLDRDHYLRKYHEKRRPDLVHRLDVMRRFRDRLDGIGPIIHKEFEKATGATPGVFAHLSRANDEAVAALNIQPTA